MKFSQYSIIQFCESVYDLNELPFGRDQISSVEMYQFIKEKSNDFDLKCFEYLILDIRNFQEKIEFKAPNPQPMPEIEIDQDTGYPSWANDQLRENYQPYLKFEIDYIYLFIEFDLDLKFTDDQTLRERVELFCKALPQASIIHDISNLLKFSDIAEKEYVRVKESTLSTTNRNIVRTNIIDINTVNNVVVGQFSAQQAQIENTQKEDYFIYSLPPTEFCEMLYRQNEDKNIIPDESEDITPLQMSQYIKTVTNNHDKPCFEYLLSDIRNFAFKIQIKTPKTDAEIAENDLSYDINGVYDFIKNEKMKYHLYTTNEFTLQVEFDLTIDIKEEVTLRERVRKIKNGIPKAIFKPGLTNLLVFSAMAEKQFEKRNETGNYNCNDIEEEQPIRIISSSKHKDIITNKKYLDLTPLDFCTFLYKPRTGLEEKEYFESSILIRHTEEISEHILYQYIKHNTNDFDKKSFEYLIADIRNFAYQITFHLPEIHQDGTESKIDFDFEQDFIGNLLMPDDYYLNVILNQPEFTIKTVGSWDGATTSMYAMRYHIPDNLTLNERHELILDKIPLATFRYGIDDLLHFSQFAENEYEKTNIPSNSNIEDKYPLIQQPIQQPIQNIPQNSNLVASNNYNKIFSNINKDNFIELIREIGKQMPDTEIRREFLENRFIEMGYSIESGYKQTSYFYNEIKKARDGQESIYKGQLIKKETTFALVDAYTCSFKFYFETFQRFEELFNKPAISIPESIIIESDDEFTPTIQTIWETPEELTIAYKKFNKLLKCDLNTWLFWFGGIPLNNPKKIKWTFKGGNKRALSYFVEKISIDHEINYSNARKVFDIHIYNKDKYELSFKEIDDLI